MIINLSSEHKSFGGKVGFYKHDSVCCKSEMRFAVYQPPQATSKPVPVLYFLAGLTSTEENFIVKAGAQRYAAEHGLMLVAPDTSPRHTGIAGEDDEWDVGSGASFYVDATVEPWQKHYQMYSYVVHELPTLIAHNFPVKPDKQGICGHSMGGHGALVCALRNPHQYQSVSAFAPIVAPLHSPWVDKAFNRYLGSNREKWRAYDACELIKIQQYHSPILIDQGTADPYLTEHLLPSLFEQACAQVNQPLTLRYQEGYDHNYYFIATFIEDHIRHHASFLN